MNCINLICPLCSNKLIKQENSLRCIKHHCFDIAKQGYVNLLPVQNKKSLHPGDTKDMLIARRNFLNSGIYTHICNVITENSIKLTEDINNPFIVDIGCGEGYYTCAIKNSIRNSNIVGVDISKDAVKMACSRSKEIDWITATAGCLPIADESTNLVTAIFSLVSYTEYSRILKNGGYVLDISAGNDHLIELKKIIYDEVYKQDKKPSQPTDNFKEIFREEQKFSFNIENKNLKNLLLMTPHFWRIKEENRQKLDNIKSLDLTAHFWLRVIQKVR